MRLDPLQRRALLNGVVAAGVTLVLGLGILAGVTSGDEEPGATSSPAASPSSSVPECTPTFEIAKSANPGDGSSWLSGVTVLSSAEAWAVGGSGDPLAPTSVLVERWDGAAWTAVDAPSPGAETNELRAVDASETNDVWAVGRTASGFGDRPLVLRYEGTEWLQMELPDEVTGVLTGVAALSPDDVWAVGYSGDPEASLQRPVILHWDGQLWAVVDAGLAVGRGASSLFAIEAVAPDDVWAAGALRGRPLVVHFDGQAWSRADVDGRGGANALAPITSNDVWSVGGSIDRFDGRSWAPRGSIREEAELFGIAAVSRRDVWAVGARTTAAGASKSLVMRFDGKRWTPVEGQPIPGSDALTAIDTRPDGTVLAVGHRDLESGRRTISIRGITCSPE